MVPVFVDLSKDNTIEEIRHPETNSLKYMGVYFRVLIKLIVNLLLSDRGYGTDKNQN